MAKISLPNGCTCSQLSVHPKNWKTVNASVAHDWYIHYRFYDPKFPKSKLVIIKGMNADKSLRDRRETTAILLEDELSNLKAGYHPIKKSVVTNQGVNDCDENAPFIETLRYSLAKIKVEKKTRTDMGNRRKQTMI